MNTLEKVKQEYAQYNDLTPLDIVGFRLFLRHCIYLTDIDFIKNQLINAFNTTAEVYGNTICIYMPSYNDNTANQIIDILRQYLSSISDKILYNINYDQSLTKQQKDAYKKILLEIPNSRCNFEYLLNISYPMLTKNPMITIML